LTACLPCYGPHRRADAPGNLPSSPFHVWRAPFAPAEIARLKEQRLAALELRVGADLAAHRSNTASQRSSAAPEHVLTRGLLFEVAGGSVRRPARSATARQTWNLAY
jgi:hypothetical protein